MKNLSNAFLVLLLTGLTACSASPKVDEKITVYHCVGSNRSALWKKETPLELFEYGDRQVENRPTFGSSTYCATMFLPSTAYLRYRLDDQVIEKRFNLSSLTPQRVANKTVEFYVDGETVEVRLITRVPGNWPIKELIDRQ